MRKRKARLRLPTAGAIISLVLHSAAAAALCAGRDLLSGSGGEWAGASASAVVTVVIDSIVDEAPTDAMASASTVVTPAPEAPVPPALAPPPEPVKDVETPPETHAADAEITTAITPQESERKPDHNDAPAQPQIAVIPPTPPAASAAIAITQTPAPKAAMSASQGDVIRYANKIRSRLASHRPRGTGQRGKVVVTFTVGSSGAVEAIDVSQSSGSSRLDRLVVSSVRDAAPFPSPPENANSGQRTFMIPFEFR